MTNLTPEVKQPAWRGWAAGLIPVVLLLPFIGKAYHIDDPVYLLVAEQILKSPLDFFGFQMNWTHQPEWVHAFNKNPPGLSYYIALFAGLFGWKETVHHAAFLLPTFLASVAVYRLAERFSPRPMLASLVAFLAPVYVISNSNIMCEPMMLAFYLWAVLLWVRGLDTESHRLLIASAVLIGVGILVKYIIVTAIPLLAAYTLLRRGKKAAPLLYFLIPILIATAYDIHTLVLYDKSIIKDAIGYANVVSGQSAHRSNFYQLMTNLSFTGGCFLTAALFLPLLFREKVIAVHLAIFAAIVFAFYFGHWDNREDFIRDGRDFRWWYILQMALYITCGVNVIFLTFHDLWNERDADSVLLFLWVMGIFTFSGFVNWTINGRALLPMAAPVGILVARQFQRPLTRRGLRLAAAPIALAVGGAVALAVSYADYRYAFAAKQIAAQVTDATRDEGGTVFFQGHRGFQYYMEKAGHRPIDLSKMTVDASDSGFGGPFVASDSLHLEEFSYGDFAVKPAFDRSIPGKLGNFTISKREFQAFASFRPAIASWVSTVNEKEGAGFYSHVHGPLPFYFGKIDPGVCIVYRFEKPSKNQAPSQPR